MLNLRELQTRFFYSLASMLDEHGGVSFDPALMRVVRGQGQLGPEERLNIYAQMYCARLIDALGEDFPRVAAILGVQRFREVAGAYLAHHPSTHPSLRYIGCHFAEFLATHAEGKAIPFLADLARLEWARLEVFDAPDAEPLQIAQLQTLPPEEWPGLQLRLIPACIILYSTWPIHEVWSAEQETLLPEAVAPAETVLRIWRDGFTVYHACMDAIERTALEQVRAGVPLAAICAALEPILPSEAAAGEVGSLLIRWVEDGILSSLCS